MFSFYLYFLNGMDYIHDMKGYYLRVIGRNWRFYVLPGMIGRANNSGPNPRAGDLVGEEVGSGLI